jgi:hypothetical protein
MEVSTTAPIVAATIGSIEEMKDPAAILELVAAACRQMREEFGDFIRVLLAAAPHDEAVSESLATGTARYRQAFVRIAQRLSDLGALREGMDVKQAVDVFWFYFGYAGLFTLVTTTDGHTSGPNDGFVRRPAERSSASTPPKKDNSSRPPRKESFSARSAVSESSGFCCGSRGHPERAQPDFDELSPVGRLRDEVEQKPELSPTALEPKNEKPETRN